MKPTKPNTAYPVKALTKSQNQTDQPNLICLTLLQQRHQKRKQLKHGKDEKTSREECEAKNIKPFEKEGKRSNTNGSNDMTVGHECKNEGSLTQYHFGKQLHPSYKYLHHQHGQHQL